MNFIPDENNKPVSYPRYYYNYPRTLRRRRSFDVNLISDDNTLENKENGLYSKYSKAEIRNLLLKGAGKSNDKSQQVSREIIRKPLLELPIYQSHPRIVYRSYDANVTPDAKVMKDKKFGSKFKFSKKNISKILFKGVDKNNSESQHTSNDTLAGTNEPTSQEFVSNTDYSNSVSIFSSEISSNTSTESLSKISSDTNLLEHDGNMTNHAYANKLFKGIDKNNSEFQHASNNTLGGTDEPTSQEFVTNTNYSNPVSIFSSDISRNTTIESLSKVLSDTKLLEYGKNVTNNTDSNKLLNVTTNSSHSQEHLKSVIASSLMEASNDIHGPESLEYATNFRNQNKLFGVVVNSSLIHVLFLNNTAGDTPSAPISGIKLSEFANNTTNNESTHKLLDISTAAVLINEFPTDSTYNEIHAFEKNIQTINNIINRNNPDKLSNITVNNVFHSEISSNIKNKDLNESYLKGIPTEPDANMTTVNYLHHSTVVKNGTNDFSTVIPRLLKRNINLEELMENNSTLHKTQRIVTKPNLKIYNRSMLQKHAHFGMNVDDKFFSSKENKSLNIFSADETSDDDVLRDVFDIKRISHKKHASVTTKALPKTKYDHTCLSDSKGNFYFRLFIYCFY